MGEDLEAPIEVAGGPGLVEGVDESGQGAVVDPAAALGGGDGKRDRKEVTSSQLEDPGCVNVGVSQLRESGCFFRELHT